MKENKLYFLERMKGHFLDVVSDFNLNAEILHVSAAPKTKVLG
jgi:hypothetical protein